VFSIAISETILQLFDFLLKHRLPAESTCSALGEIISVWGTIEIDDDGIGATIHSKVDGHRKETDYFCGKTFRELEADMGSSNYPFDEVMEKVRSLRYWPRLKKMIEQEEIDQSFEIAKNHSFGEILAQNKVGTVKIGNRKFWTSNFARKTVLVKDNKEFETSLDNGPIKNVSFNEVNNTFNGTLQTKNNDYSFEICADSGEVIRKDEI